MNAIIFGSQCPGLVGCLTCPRGSSPVPLVRESGLGLLWSFACPRGSTVLLVRESGLGLLWSFACPRGSTVFLVRECGRGVLWSCSCS